MPQEQHVVRCYACKKFQVQIVKKVPKWQCKVCREKQSLMKVYAQGSGKDCRLHVQNLNMQQGLLSQETPDYDINPATHYEETPIYNAENQSVNNKASKWSEYLADDGPSQAGARSWEEGKDLPNNMSRGRKRKLSNPDEYEDYATYEESYQPEAEVLDLSSGSCASDILRNLYVKQESSKTPILPHSSTFSGFTNTKSKWSQFVSPQETDPPVSGNENQETLSNGSRDKFIATAAPFRASIPFATRNPDIIAKSIDKQSVMNAPNECTLSGNGFSSNGVVNKATSSSIVINPFNTTDDDNLDTLLDF